MFLIFTLFKAFINLFTISMTICPALNAGLIDKSTPDNAGDNSGKDGKEVEMKDPTANETQSKSGEDPPIANQDLEVELFLHGITDQLKWQELVSKWRAFENDYQIKGVFIFFLHFSFVRH